jgi:hypothetical protein
MALITKFGIGCGAAFGFRYLYNQASQKNYGDAKPLDESAAHKVAQVTKQMGIREGAVFFQTQKESNFCLPGPFPWSKPIIYLSSKKSPSDDYTLYSLLAASAQRHQQVAYSVEAMLLGLFFCRPKLSTAISAALAQQIMTRLAFLEQTRKATELACHYAPADAIDSKLSALDQERIYLQIVGDVSMSINYKNSTKFLVGPQPEREMCFIQGEIRRKPPLPPITLHSSGSSSTLSPDECDQIRKLIAGSTRNFLLTYAKEIHIDPSKSEGNVLIKTLTSEIPLTVKQPTLLPPVPLIKEALETPIVAEIVLKLPQENPTPYEVARAQWEWDAHLPDNIYNKYTSRITRNEDGTYTYRVNKYPERDSKIGVSAALKPRD